MANGQKADIQLVIDLVNLAKGKVAKAMKDFQKAQGSAKSIKKLDAELRNLGATEARLNKVMLAAGKIQRQQPFQGWALSIMFAGMAIKNAMNQIWASSTKTFQEVMHSVEGATTGFDILEGSMKYLGFTIGQALEPIAMWLVPIVDYVATWISENEGLTRTLFVILTVFGTLSTIIGMAVLSVAGFAQAWVLAGPVIVGVLTGIKTAMAFLMANPFILLIAGIALAMTWIYKLQESMGGWAEFAKSVIRGILRAFVLMGDGLLWIFNGVGDAFKWMINLVIDAINKLLQSSIVQWGLNKLGIDFEKINRLEYSNYSFGDLFSQYAGWEASSALAPSQGYLGSTSSNNTQQTTNNTYNVTVNGVTDWNALLDQVKAQSNS